MNGFVLHVNNNLKKSVFYEKTPSIAAKPYFSTRAYCKLKTSVAASRNIAWFSKRDSAAGQPSRLWSQHGDRYLITVLVDPNVKMPAWYCREDEAVMLFDLYFTFESKLGWHRLFLTVESTRGIRTLSSYSVWIVGRNGRMGMVSLTNNFKFCRLNWK